MLLPSGSTRLLRLMPLRRWSTGPTALRPSTREIASPPTLYRDRNVDLPTTLVKPDGPSEPRPPLVIHEGALTPVLVLLSSTLVPRSTNELRFLRRRIEWRRPPSILAPGRCQASPPPSPKRQLCLPSPGLRAMPRRPIVTPNPLRSHPSLTPRRDLGQRNRFLPFLLSSHGVPTARYLSPSFVVSILTLPSRL